MIMWTRAWLGFVVMLTLGNSWGLWGEEKRGTVDALGCPYQVAGSGGARDALGMPGGGGAGGHPDVDYRRALRMMSSNSTNDDTTSELDKLQIANKRLHDFHLRQRSRMLRKQLQGGGILTTCGIMYSLCVLADDDDGSVDAPPKVDCSKHQYPQRSSRYERAKEASHIALSTYLILAPHAGAGDIGISVMEDIVLYRNQVVGARLEEVNVDSFPSCPVVIRAWTMCWPIFHKSMLSNEDIIWASSESLLNRTIETGIAPSLAEVSAFASSLAPLLNLNLDAAAQDKIDFLHAGTLDMVAKGAITNLNDVIGLACVSHMAKEKEIGVQYLSRLLSIPEPGEATHKLVVFEGFDFDKAIDLVGVHLTDWDASERFFGDPDRLHRDALADSAATYLMNMPLPGLPPPINVPAHGSGSSPSSMPIVYCEDGSSVWTTSFQALFAFFVISLLVNVLVVVFAYNLRKGTRSEKFSNPLNPLNSLTTTNPLAVSLTMRDAEEYSPPVTPTSTTL